MEMHVVIERRSEALQDGQTPRPVPEKATTKTLPARRPGVHSHMEIWSAIRREVLTGALSKRAAIAMYGIDWHTLKKMLAHDEPPGYRPPAPAWEPPVGQQSACSAAGPARFVDRSSQSSCQPAVRVQR